MAIGDPDLRSVITPLIRSRALEAVLLYLLLRDVPARQLVEGLAENHRPPILLGPGFADVAAAVDAASARVADRS